MLVLLLHRTQLEALERAREQQYQRDLVGYFRRDRCEAVRDISDETLLEIIECALGRARRLGVETANGLLTYVTMAVVVNRDFDQVTEVRSMLDAPGFDPDYKVQLLSDLLISKLAHV